MTQKVIQIGNSLAITIPKKFADEVGLKVGQSLQVEHDVVRRSFHVALTDQRMPQSDLTPEFVEWLEKFNSKYKKVLTALANK